MVYVLMHVVAKGRQYLEKNHPVADQQTGDLSRDLLALPAAIEIELEIEIDSIRYRKPAKLLIIIIA